MSNFNFIENGNWGSYLLINTDNLDETINYIKENNIKNIELNFYHGYKLKNITRLKELNNIIEGINIIEGDIDLNGIQDFKNLKRLNISDELNYPIDFSRFPKLEKCNLLWHENLLNIEKCAHLFELVIKKIKITEQITEIFRGLKKIQKLTFIQSKLENLDYLKCFPILQELNIFYCPSLKDINGLKYVKDSITKLIIEHCKNVIDYKVISKLEGIRYLVFNHVSDIPTLAFIKNLEKLKHFAFMNTSILDGDMSFCLKIEYVSFRNKKHYSHTLKQIQGV